MNKKSFTDSLSGEVLAQIIDDTLNFKKTAKERNISMHLLKIIPAVAAIVLVVGLANIVGNGNINVNIDNMFRACPATAITTESVENTASININEAIMQNTEIVLASEEIPEHVVINNIYYRTDRTELFLSSIMLKDDDIKQLRYMVNLQTLCLLYSATSLSEDRYAVSHKMSDIKDISPIAGLTNLKTLYLEAHQISDISALAGLMNLTKLSIDNTQISDVSPIAGLTNLTELNLSHNQISDISVLTGLMNLVWLDLQGNPISAEQIAELRVELPYTEILADY